MGKIKKDKIVEELTNLPGWIFQGPLLKYKLEYRKRVKQFRRGEAGFWDDVSVAGQEYAETKARESNKITDKDIADIKETIEKIQKLVTSATEKMAQVTAITASYLALKKTLTTLAGLSEKANAIAAAATPHPPGVPLGGPFALIAWLKRKFGNWQKSLAFMATWALVWLEYFEATLILYASNIIEAFAKGIRQHFHAKVAKAVRAEKWGTALKDDVERSQNELDDAWAYQRDQKNTFDAKVRGLDMAIFTEVLMEERKTVEEVIAEDEAAGAAADSESTTTVTTDTRVYDPTFTDPDQTMVGNYPFSAANFYSTEAFGSHANAVDARTTLVLANGYETWDAYKTAVPLADRKLFWDSNPSIW